MLFEKKQRFKPLYKGFLKLRENVQNRAKLLNFKKEKWGKLIQHCIKRQKRYKKYTFYDCNRYIVSKYSSKQVSYKKRYRTSYLNNKKVKYFFGIHLKKNLKTNVRKSFNDQKGEKMNNLSTTFLTRLESRLDVVLYRAKFCNSIRSAQQLIIHGKILVNNKFVRIKSHRLHSFDIISVKSDYKELILSNMRKAIIWPVSPKYLVINYKILQIVYLEPTGHNFLTNYNFNLNLEKLIINFKHT